MEAKQAFQNKAGCTSMHRNSWLLLACYILLLVGPLGCSSREQPVSVRGSVILDGKPLSAGKIVFQPMELLQRGQMREATIHDGKFELSVKEGLLPETKFKVLIKAFKKTGKKYPAGDMPGSFDEEIQYLPARYNSATTLNANISAEDAKNEFTFELTSHK